MSKKQTRRALLLLCLLAGIVILAGGVLEAKSDMLTAQVSFLEGNVVAKASGGEYKPIAKGDELSADYTVKTYKGAKLELTLPDKSVLRVAPLSVVKLKSLIKKTGQKKGKTDFKVTSGKIWANVSTALGSDYNFEVSTNNAVAGVRGTIFRVDVMDDQATVVRVYSGSVAVNNSPIYARTTDTKGERVQVAGPKEVSKKKWEELVAKTMQEVRVEADGVIRITEFPKSDKDAWKEWNEERDKTLGIKH